ncbi:MAG: hypothetical protein WBC43_13530, partial [Olleya sp.]
IKGISALGNQLTKDKVNAINLLEPIPYEAPEETPAEDIEVKEEENISEKTESKTDEISSKDDDNQEYGLDDKGQVTLF